MYLSARMQKYPAGVQEQALHRKHFYEYPKKLLGCLWTGSPTCGTLLGILPDCPGNSSVSGLFIHLFVAKAVTLGWDANPEPDLEGYIIYRNVGSPGSRHTNFPVHCRKMTCRIRSFPAVKLTGLKENTEYFVAVTAYDKEGNESYFSDEICVEIVDSVIENCSASLISNPNSNSNSGSNGSGGSSGRKSLFH